MTVRGLSAWFAIGCGLLAILVAVDRPHWFGLSSRQPTVSSATVDGAAAPDPRSSPWIIRRAAAATR